MQDENVGKTGQGYKIKKDVNAVKKEDENMRGKNWKVVKKWTGMLGKEDGNRVKRQKLRKNGKGMSKRLGMLVNTQGILIKQDGLVW